jgi:hypothetical protein
LGKAIKGFERLIHAVLEDYTGTRNPIGKLTMYEVPNDIKGTPGLGSFVAA